MGKQEENDLWEDPTGGVGIIGMIDNIMGKHKANKTTQQIQDMKDETEMLKAKADLENAKKEYKRKTGKDADNGEKKK